MKDSTIPTLLGIAIILVGIIDGALFIKNSQIFKISAANQNKPENVRVSNTGERSFTVSWTTQERSLGFVRWGVSSMSLSKTALDTIKNTSYIHYVNVGGLSPDKKYYFKINSNGADFDNNGLAWQLNTAPAILSKPESNIISGNVLTQYGSPAQDVLVYAVVGGGSFLSTLTSSNGDWVIPISATRTKSLDSYVLINDSSTPIEIFVQSGTEVSSAQMYPSSAKPAPPMVLGKIYNFRSTPLQDLGEIPKANIYLPTIQ